MNEVDLLTLQNMLKYWLKFSPFKKKWVEFFTSSTESSEANENLTYHHTFRMKRNILLICLLGILFHWHFSVKKKKIVRLRFSYSFVYVDSTRFQLASSMKMKNFCTTLFICILDIYSAILLAIVSNFVSIFRYIRMSFIHWHTQFRNPDPECWKYEIDFCIRILILVAWNTNQQF